MFIIILFLNFLLLFCFVDYFLRVRRIPTQQVVDGHPLFN
jgi:hypothetical protein